MIKKADILLGVLLVVICLSSLLLLHKTGQAGSLVTISVDGEPYGTYDLSEAQQIDIQQNKEGLRRNVIEIKDNAVFMVESSCKNQVCVHGGKITRSNQTLVCLPNHVVVGISAATHSPGDMDAVSY